MLNSVFLCFYRQIARDSALSLFREHDIAVARLEGDDEIHSENTFECIDKLALSKNKKVEGSDCKSFLCVVILTFKPLEYWTKFWVNMRFGKTPAWLAVSLGLFFKARGVGWQMQQERLELSILGKPIPLNVSGTYLKMSLYWAPWDELTTSTVLGFPEFNQHSRQWMPQNGSIFRCTLRFCAISFPPSLKKCGWRWRQHALRDVPCFLGWFGVVFMSSRRPCFHTAYPTCSEFRHWYRTDEEAWGSVSIPVHPKDVQRGWGHGCVRDARVLPCQPRQIRSSRSSLCVHAETVVRSSREGKV